MAVVTSLSSGTASITITTTDWMLSDSTDDTVFVGQVKPDVRQSRAVKSSVVRVLSRATDVVVTDVVGDQRLELTFQNLTSTQQDALETLLARGRAMTLRSTRYPTLLVRLTGDIDTSIESAGPSTIWLNRLSLSKVTA